MNWYLAPVTAYCQALNGDVRMDATYWYWPKVLTTIAGVLFLHEVLAASGTPARQRYAGRVVLLAGLSILTG